MQGATQSLRLPWQSLALSPLKGMAARTRGAQNEQRATWHRRKRRDAVMERKRSATGSRSDCVVPCISGSISRALAGVTRLSAQSSLNQEVE